MKKIIFQMMISIDGCYEGPNKEIDWHNVDAEFNDYAIDLLNNAEVLLFGRVTYQMMASYWPTEFAMTDDPVVAGLMNSLPKIVFSRTLTKADWNNTRIVKDNIAEEIQKLKKEATKDIVLMGSSDLALTFIQLGLIDEYRVIVNPLVLGEGKSLFSGIKDRLKLKLGRSITYSSGNVMLCYEPLKS